MRFKITYTKRTHEELTETEVEESFDSWQEFFTYAEQLEQPGCDCWYELTKFERLS